jgi:hypothetical protein
MITALAIIPLFAALGLAIDGAQGYLLKTRLSSATDAAGLAGGRAFDAKDREADILMYFHANYPDDFMQAELVGGKPIITFDDESNTVTIEAFATLPTRLMKVVGIPEITVSARTVIQRQVPGMELVLVMDNTGFIVLQVLDTAPGQI